VLAGARDGLQRRAFRVIEFEYHAVGAWRWTSLNQTVFNLSSYGYRCYWQGNKGSLMTFRFDCDNEIRRWSNMVCTHDDKIVKRFTTLLSNNVTKKIAC
jgi:hypothetical protein